MRLTLPWPPSVNRYWRSIGGRAILSAEGRAYRARAQTWRTFAPTLTGRLRVRLELHAPDNRRRDVDNSCKAVLDAMTHAEVYGDDSQIDRLEVVRCGVDRAKPRVDVEVVEL